MKIILVNILAFLSIVAHGSQVSEHILGFDPSETGIQFRVESDGCTSKSDFSIAIHESHPVQIELIRDVPDNCESYVAYGETINFSWEETGLKLDDRFVIVNPLSIITVVSDSQRVPIPELPH